jgi:hypothetical protein
VNLKLFWRGSLCLWVTCLGLVSGPISSRAQIKLVPNWSQDEASQTGFFDPILGQLRRNTFLAAAGYLGGLFSPAYPGETIQVKASFRLLNGRALGNGGPIGLVSSDTFKSSNLKFRAHTDYSYALANHLSGTNLNAGDLVEVEFNSSSSILWSFSTNDTPPLGSPFESFYMTVIHEIVHGLGFIDGMDPVTAGYTYGNLLPMAYDRFLVKGERERLPLVNMTNAGRRAAITSGDLYWNGPSATSANGGKLVKLYAPNPYEPEGSVSHLDPAVFDAQGLLMLAEESTVAKLERSLSPVELGMLFDMGFTPAGKSPPQILGIARQGGAITISFATQPGVIYRLRFTSSPSTPLANWETHPARVTGDGITRWITDTAGTASRFYAVEATP